MKRIVLFACIVTFLLTGCTFGVSTEKIEKMENHDEYVENAQNAETGDESLKSEEENVDIDVSELYGTWKSPKGAPLIINNDGTAESVAVKSKGTYTLNRDKLVIYWPEYDKSETYRVEEKNGVVSIIYGSDPLVYVYNKE